MIKEYDNIENIATGQADDYTTDCLLGYLYFKEHYKMITIDLSKQQEVDADPKSKQQINSTGELDRIRNKAMSSIIEEAKETILNFSEETVKVL